MDDQSGIGRSTTLREIPNVLYNIPITESENQEYETVGSRIDESTVNYSVPLQHQQEGGGISMKRNESYGVSNAGGSHRESRHDYDNIPQ